MSDSRPSDRIALDLHSGAHSALVPELTTLVAENPLRERLIQLFMAALHSSGRTAEALETFHKARGRLIEELGVEPGAALQHEYRRLLGTASPGLGGPVSHPVPRQLPSDISAFAGRTEPTSYLNRLLDEHERIGEPLLLALNGFPGSGKTTLAVHWAHGVADRFPDGNLYVNLRGFGQAAPAPEPVAVLRGFLDALGVPPDQIPDGLDECAARYRSLLAGRRILVILDNARDEDQVRPLLPGSGGSCAVVTSRHQLTGLATQQSAWSLHVDMIEPSEARALLERRLGRDRVAADPAAVSRIIERCAGLPLSLAIVAAQADARDGFSLAAIADELETSEPVLDAFSSLDATSDLRTVFSWSYRGLSRDAARLFRLLGLHWGPDFAVEAAASLSGLPVRDTRRLVDELCRMRLLIELAPGRFAFHDLLGAYAAELVDAIDTASDRRQAVRRLLDHYLHSAHAAADLMAPYRLPALTAEPSLHAIICAPVDHNHATSWFEAEHAALMNALACAHRAEFGESAWLLAPPFAIHLRRQGLDSEWLTVQRLAVAAAERSDDLPAKCCREALEAATELDDPVGIAVSLDSLGFTQAMLGRYESAIDSYRRSAALLRGHGEKNLAAVTLVRLGEAYQAVGDHDAVVEAWKSALRTLEELGHPDADHVRARLSRATARRGAPTMPGPRS